MPHVVYLHSALTQSRVVGRNDAERKQILRFEKIDVIIAMTLAGLVNMSMVIVAAGLFNAGGLIGIDSIEGAYAGLQMTVSDNAATIFGDRPARLRARLDLGRDDGRPGRHAGVHPSAGSR